MTDHAKRACAHRQARRRRLLFATTLLTMGTAFGAAHAQQDLLRPGEGIVTRFSGVAAGGDPNQPAVIDVQGTVASIVDLRNPGQPPQGQHWIDEPQRNPITAAQVGQVFGVTLTDTSPPSVFLAATSAFGLHRTPDNAQWMPGMWGAGGNPGTIYVLDRTSGYQPRVFTQVTLAGRQNTGAGLGNIAYDKWNKQLFVSDLETGVIHRIRLSDGVLAGQWDHGVQGRAAFMDAEAKQQGSLPPIAFDPNSRARIADCPSGKFEQSPECWNFAASGRRVWGLGVARHAQRGDTRLYYAVWSGPAFGNAAWNQASEDDKRNSVWSVRLGPDGGFDPSDVRREFMMPDFFSKPEDIARAGYSQPVSDITFPECGDRPIMLLAERGGIRNLGLAADAPFATPHESRALRYELDPEGNWKPAGRYDVGFYDRRDEGAPLMRANCSGGVAFNYGYETTNWTLDRSKPDQYVWISGDALCSAKGPCVVRTPVDANFDPNAPQAGAQPQQPSPQPAALQDGEQQQQPDDSEVHGIQGMAETGFSELVPASAFADAKGQDGDAAGEFGPLQAWLVDIDLNIDQTGGLDEQELTRNDATKVGDVAIYQACPTPSAGFAMPVMLAGAAPLYIAGGHPTDISHGAYASHGRSLSHRRFGSHAPEFSHNRYGSHYRYWSHYRTGSHNQYWSHNRWRSHDLRRSHTRWGSHNRVFSHHRIGSHNTRLSHLRFGSHNRAWSHSRTGSHNAQLSHSRLRSHSTFLSHSRLGSHNTALSHVRGGSHNTRLSHNRLGSHLRQVSIGHTRSLSSGGGHSTVLSFGHTVALSQGHRAQISRGPVHNVIVSRGPIHNVVISRGPAHNTFQSRGPTHNPVVSRGPIHNPVISRGPTHNPVVSRGPTHNPVVSRGPIHNAVVSRGQVHSRALSRGTVTPIHNRALSQRTVKPVHNVAVSRAAVRPVHNVAVSRASVRPVHNPAVSRRVVRPPRVQRPPVVRRVQPAIRRVQPTVRRVQPTVRQQQFAPRRGPPQR